MTYPRIYFLLRTFGVLALLSVHIACAQTKVFEQMNSSMEPTLLKGESFSADMKRFLPHRGELVVLSQENKLLIKRVIAVGGDVVQGHNLSVSVNGQELKEEYVQHTGKPPLDPKTLETFGPITVPEGFVFAVGDNRDFSLDSRDPRFGVVSVADVKAKPLKIVRSEVAERIGKELR